jgi:branched-chain amino acid transport system permease protein
VASFTVLRGSDLTRLMVTLGVALILLELANKLDWLTGGTDGIQGLVFSPLLGKFEFDLAGRTALYSLVGAAAAVPGARRIVQLALRRHAEGDPRQPAARHGHRHPGACAADRDLHHRRGDGRRGRALFTQTSGFASLDVFEFHRSADVMLMLVIGGVGWLYGGVTGAIVFKLMQDFISQVTPQYWTFWIGLFLVVLVLVGRDRLFKPWTWFRRRAVR